MKAELITDLDALATVEEGWRRLAVQRGNAFLSPDWYRAWVRADGRQHTPAVVATRDQTGEISGVVPLVLDRGSRPHALRFGGSSFGDRFGIAAPRSIEDHVAEAAIAELEQAGFTSMLVLHRVDAESEWPERMAAASGRRLAVVDQGTAELPHVKVAGLDWEGYLAERSQKFRQRVGRGLERALERDGIEFAVRETSDPARLDEDMATLFRLHDLRHEASDSSIVSEQVRESLRTFADGALERGWLRLRILELDGHPAAAFLGWRLGPSYAVYQSGFDPAWAEQSAGMLLLNDTVRAAIAEDAEEVDLLLGGEAFKWRFAPDPRVVRTVIVVGAARPARLLASGEAFARERGRRLARHPRLRPAARSLARLLPGGRG